MRLMLRILIALYEQVGAKETFKEEEAREIAKTLLSALKHMHDTGVVHRDLKPQNIIYDSDSSAANLKIVDFGTASFFEGTMSTL
jgi:serine/threonine protein kinase